MKWFGPQVPVLPLTVEKIQGVAAQFKRGRYRSFSNYVQRMKDEHEEQGHNWTRPLARTMKKCVRSCERGIGPARQSGVFNIPDVRAQNFPHDPLVEGGPISPGEMLEVGPFYGKRGIELELALYTSYRLTHKNTLVVSWQSRKQILEHSVLIAPGVALVRASGLCLALFAPGRHMTRN